MVPEAIASVRNASIRGFYRLAAHTIDAYSAGLRYGTEEFKHNAYRSRRQVEGKSKWWAGEHSASMLRLLKKEKEKKMTPIPVKDFPNHSSGRWKRHAHQKKCKVSISNLNLNLYATNLSSRFLVLGVGSDVTSGGRKRKKQGGADVGGSKVGARWGCG